MNHSKIEKNIGLMTALIIVVISFGGLAEIVPLFWEKSTTEPAKGLRPFTALELEGRDVYIREGCNTCHTQMIRPLQAETQRYGAPVTAEEQVYEHPFLWGSKRTGPDLARVGKRYSDSWHYEHLMDPRSVVPESIMPAYPWLDKNEINASTTPKKLSALAKLGVPYTPEMIASASQDVQGKTEMDAVIAYLQALGQNIDKPKE
jgi:cytochrome c oxidase cbb3-type subunit 2